MKQAGVHRVAVFDVDGTLLRGDCLWLAARRSKSLKGQLLAVLAEITYRPEITVALAAAEAEKMQKILDVLDELDDVQEVYHNAEL